MIAGLSGIVTSMADRDRIRREAPLSFRVWTGRPGGMPQAHKHADIEVNHVRRGWVSYVLGGQRVRLEEGEVGLFWATAPHQILARADRVELGWAVLSLSMVRGWGLPERLLSQLWSGAMLVDREIEADDRRRWSQWEAMLGRSRPSEAPSPTRDDRWRRVVELEVEARLLRMILRGPEIRSGGAQGSTEAAGPTPHADDASAVERMVGYLSDHFTEPVRVADVAAHVHLHPAYAMRQFKQVMGMTIGDYLTRQRIAEARRRLISSDHTVLSVALDSGFGSLSQFHHCFRRETGQTPARFRRALRRQAGPSPA
jgi:AraC-like DNA-binding protein